MVSLGNSIGYGEGFEMAEKTTPKKRATRKAMVELVADTEKVVAERQDAEAKPEERLAAKEVREAVAVADALSSEDVVRSIGEMKSTIARTLGQLADRLEEEIGKYSQIRRAIAAKDAELKEIYEIERSASTLLAILETQRQQQEDLEREFQTEKEQLESEIAATRAEWEKERKEREQEIKERDAAEQKRRQREAEEYKYSTAREQQLAQDRLKDALAKGEKELSERKTQLEREWAEREKALAASEEELTQLRTRAAGFAEELKAASNQVAADTTARLEQQHRAEDELLRQQLEGEKNVLTAKVASLERTVKDQAEQLARLQEQAEKAYAQVQEIAVRAIEGSANAKQLAHLQQLLADQARKSSSER
jgi:hypothetical protein